MVHMHFRIPYSTSTFGRVRPAYFMVRAMFAWAAIFWGAPCATIAGETVLLDFSSPTCGPCHQMRPVIHQLAQAGYPVREIDMMHQSDWADHFGVTQVPAFVLVVDNREVSRLVGATSYQQLEGMFLAAGIRPHREPAANRQGPVPAPPAQPQMGPPIDRQGIASTGQPNPGQSAIARQPASPGQLASPGKHAGQMDQMSGSAPPAKSKSAGGGGSSQLALPLVESAVRITVGDPQGNSTGTGTIVDARDGEALVLTCGHIFRASAGKGTITVTLFQAGSDGPDVRTTLTGNMVNYDLERDLGLVSIHMREPVRVAPLAPQGTRLSSGSRVTTVGCNHGDNPTAIRSQITSVDRYQGPPNVQVAGAPVEGRSGGGLFNEQGQLVGVCFAADPQSNEGLYSSVRSIHAKLDSLQLAKVYQHPSLGNPASNPIFGTPDATSHPFARAPQEVLLAAAESGPPASDSAAAQVVRGQEPSMPAAQFAFNGGAPATLASGSQTGSSHVPVPAAIASLSASERATGQATNRASMASLSASERATLEEINRRGAESEVIVIIHPQTPNGKSEVITVQHASADFVRALVEPPSGTPPLTTRPQQTAQVPATGTLR